MRAKVAFAMSHTEIQALSIPDHHLELENHEWSSWQPAVLP